MKEINEISNINLNDLFKEYHDTKNPLIRENIINNTLDYVKEFVTKKKDYYEKIITQNAGFSITLEDIMQYGYEGLINAIDNYDPNTVKAGFKSFSNMYIQKTIAGHIQKEGRYIYIPNIALIKKYLKYQEKMRTMNGKEPSSLEIAKQMNISTEKLLEVELCINMLNPESYEKITNGLKDYDLEEGVIKDDRNYPEDYSISEDNLVENFIFEKDKNEKVLELVNSLKSNMEKEVLVLRFGLNGDSPKTQGEIAKLLGVNRARVEQIEHSALRKLRNPEKLNILGDYLKEEESYRRN